MHCLCQENVKSGTQCLGTSVEYVKEEHFSGLDIEKPSLTVPIKKTIRSPLICPFCLSKTGLASGGEDKHEEEKGNMEGRKGEREDKEVSGGGREVSHPVCRWGRQLVCNQLT